jgi:hypothetical protein
MFGSQWVGLIFSLASIIIPSLVEWMPCDLGASYSLINTLHVLWPSLLLTIRPSPDNAPVHS